MGKAGKESRRSIFVAAVVVAIVACLLIFFSGQSSAATEEFAECLTDRGAVMYGTDWCHYCQDQKEMFGMHFEKINYVNCDYDKAECDIAGVRGYPTWKINGVNYPGVQQIEKLSELTGCEV